MSLIVLASYKDLPCMCCLEKRVHGALQQLCWQFLFGQARELLTLLLVCGILGYRVRMNTGNSKVVPLIKEFYDTYLQLLRHVDCLHEVATAVPLYSCVPHYRYLE